MIQNITDVGVDIGYKDSEHSWAVVCIKGKVEYVKFIPLSHENSLEVLKFLKQLVPNKDNRIIDSPLRYEDIVDNYMLRKE